MEDINTAMLTGLVERQPSVIVSDHGTPACTFTLHVTEAGPAGQAFTLFLPCLAYGQAATVAQALHGGETVLIQGRLKWRKYRTAKGEDKNSLVVNARLIRVLLPVAALAEAGR